MPGASAAALACFSDPVPWPVTGLVSFVPHVSAVTVLFFAKRPEY